MPSVSDWKVPPPCNPSPRTTATTSNTRSRGYGARHRAAGCVTAETLGTERAGNGVFIRGNGLVLTIGYLITEADTIWIALDRRPLGARPPARLSTRRAASAWCRRSAKTRRAGDGDRRVGDRAGGRRARSRRRPRRRHHSVAAGTVDRQAGVRRLLGIRTRGRHLHRASASEMGRHRTDRAGWRSPRHRLAAVAARRREGQTQNINMIVPIDLLKPIVDDLMKFGRRNAPPRPWLGLYATEVENRLVIVGSPTADRQRKRICAPATS